MYLEQIDHHMIELDDGSKPMDRVQVWASRLQVPLQIVARAARALRVGAGAVTAYRTEGPTRRATVTCGTRQWSLQWTECAL